MAGSADGLEDPFELVRVTLDCVPDSDKAVSVLFQLHAVPDDSVSLGNNCHALRFIPMCGAHSLVADTDALVCDRLSRPHDALERNLRLDGAESGYFCRRCVAVRLFRAK